MVVTNGVTASQMMHRAARVQPGRTVVVHGVLGGVGTLFVQLSRLAGATVIGTEPASKHDAVRALGAIPIDYRTKNVPEAVRQIAAAGRVRRSFDLRDIGRVYPLVTVPNWIAGSIFYDLLGRIATRLLLPLLVGYTAYRVAAYALAAANDGSTRFSVWDSYRTLPGVQTLFAEVAWDTLLLVSVFILFLFTIRRAAMQIGSALTSKIPGEPAHAFGLGSPASDIERLLATDANPPMHRDLPGNRIHIFVPGHTHAPISRQGREMGEALAVMW